MKRVIKKILNRASRHKRIRARVQGTQERPRLAFFRSNKNVYAQLIDDTTGTTLVGISSLKATENGSVAKATTLGVDIAKKASEKGIKKVVFDKGGFMYTGSVKAFADAARSNGLEF